MGTLRTISTMKRSWKVAIEGSHWWGNHGHFRKRFPVREIREKRGFQPKSGRTFSNQGTFFKTIFKHFNLKKDFFYFLGSVSVINWYFCKYYPNGRWRPHFKITNLFFYQNILMKTKKKSGENLRKSEENQGISWDKKLGSLLFEQTPICYFVKLILVMKLGSDEFLEKLWSSKTQQHLKNCFQSLSYIL